ncbi:proline dehydrogenase family protein [Limnobacter litoralis]|uniref:Bifunctional protein PutA n=1 Tax=Limnobacter litoralis TaxID=481366 RepID=A0ABQ5YNN6_9BURK|nr:proline dehydrogenase family protein [Limnobacter litoralis]GLR26213.1 bifunctional protein PutA [Limnobacter litoralis]
MRLLGTGPGASRISTVLSNETPDEGVCLRRSSETLGLSKQAQQTIGDSAAKLVTAMRASKPPIGSVEGLLQQFPLTTRAGRALMQLAESYLRTPDSHHRGLLIAEYLGICHQDNETSGALARWLKPVFKQLSLVEHHNASGHASWLERHSDPLIQRAVASAIESTGEQFLLAQDLQQAQSKAEKQHWLCSFDILGEGARTRQDADTYFSNYLEAAKALQAPHGLSIKLSALSPRFEEHQREAELPMLIDKVVELAQVCLRKGVPLTLDAEENARLLMTLEVLEGVANQIGDLPPGLGLAVQAYNRRSLAVIEALIGWAAEHHPGLQIRLVKGAYWDHEIAFAQRHGYSAFPVFTNKAGTDLNYLACARMLLNARPTVYPMFATHNAHTVAAILHMARETLMKEEDPGFEFQRLHGMGESLWRALKTNHSELPACRVYAPIGQYDTALAYLIRRLLENGANSSFVNAVNNPNVTIDTLVESPARICENTLFLPNPDIRTPETLFEGRKNSPGLNLNERETQAWLEHRLLHFKPEQFEVESTRPDQAKLMQGMEQCKKAQQSWAATPVKDRVALLQRWAELIIKNKEDLIALLVTEAGKTWADAVAEWREGIDFIHHYCAEGLRALQTPTRLPGPAGEDNQLVWHPRGICLCISPWNFPMAIFLGQIVACLVGGNGVLAKAAPQTQKLTALLLKLAQKAGLPDPLIQNLGPEAASADAAVKTLPVDAVFFTGSTATARTIALNLATKPGPIIPFVAETGGVNCMIVDSTALLEQVCDAIVQSAFGSAGQRCSALRVVYVQEDISERLKTMVTGAMALLRVGKPVSKDIDIGPLIDESAWRRMQTACRHFGLEEETLQADQTFEFKPRLIEIALPGELQTEWFGPLLQWVSYGRDQFETVCSTIEQSGWGLTFGLHSRLPSRAQRVANLPVGNVYINRSMTGAVVGSQPFGGQGFSGTGPKAGGHHILFSAMVERCVTHNTAAVGGVVELMTGAKPRG